MINFEHQCLSFPTCMASPMAGWTHGPTHPWHRLGDVCPTVDSWISKPLYGGVLLAGHSVEWTLPAAPTCCTILGSPLVATSHGLVPLALWDLPPLVGSLVLCWHWNLAWLAWKGLVAHWEAWLWRRLHLAWLDWEVDLGAWAKDWDGDLVEWLALQVSLVAWLAWKVRWGCLVHLVAWLGPPAKVAALLVTSLFGLVSQVVTSLVGLDGILVSNYPGWSTLPMDLLPVSAMLMML